MAKDLASLPLEILLFIFLCLDLKSRISLGRSCKRMHSVLNDSTLWKSIEIYKVKSTTSSLVSFLKRCSPYVERFRMEGHFPLKSTGKLISMFANIESLALRPSRTVAIDSAFISSICEACKCLSEVVLYIDRFPFDSIHKDSHILNLLRPFFYRSKPYNRIVLYCTNMAAGQLLYNTHEYKRSINQMISDVLSFWLKNVFSAPQNLDLHFLRPDCGNAQLAQSVDYSLLSKLLSKVNPERSAMMGTKSVLSVCLCCRYLLVQGKCKPHFQCALQPEQTSPMLASLPGDIEGSSHLVKVNEFVICYRFPNKLWLSGISCELGDFKIITHLDLSFDAGLNSHNLQVVAQQCTKLRALNIQRCTSAMNDFEGLGAVIASCKQLHFLNILGIHLKENQKEESMKIWKIIAQSKLQNILISSCFLAVPSKEEASSEALITLFSRFATLKALYVSINPTPKEYKNCVPCLTLSDTSLKMVVECPSIEYINIQGVTRGYPSALRKLLSDSCKLKSVSVGNACGMFSSVALPLPQNNHNIYLSICQLCFVNKHFDVPDVICEALGRNGKLTHLCLHVRSVSRRGLECILKGNPNLSLVEIIISSTEARGKVFQKFVKDLTTSLSCPAVIFGFYKIAFMNPVDIHSTWTLSSCLTTPETLWHICD